MSPFPTPHGWEPDSGISCNGELYLMHKGEQYALWVWTEEIGEWRILERWKSRLDGVGALNHYRNKTHAGKLTIAELGRLAEQDTMKASPLYGRF